MISKLRIQFKQKRERKTKNRVQIVCVRWMDKTNVRYAAVAVYVQIVHVAFHFGFSVFRYVKCLSLVQTFRCMQGFQQFSLCFSASAINQHLRETFFSGLLTTMQLPNSFVFPLWMHAVSSSISVSGYGGLFFFLFRFLFLSLSLACLFSHNWNSNDMSNAMLVGGFYLNLNLETPNCFRIGWLVNFRSL